MDAGAVQPVSGRKRRRGVLPVTAHNRKWWTVAALALPLVILTLDFFGIAVALPTIGRDLNASTTSLGWIVNAFGLAFAAPLLALGRLGDLFGRRKVLLLGTGLFAVASALAGIAPAEWWLITARVLQGVGAAMFFVSSLSLVSNAFPSEQRALGIGIWSGAGGIGQSIGPLVGGTLTELLSWRWFFFVNIPIAVVAIVLTLMVVEEARDETAEHALDLAGFVTVTAGLVLLVLGLQLSGSRGWTSPLVLTALVGGVVMLGLFTSIELHSPHPLIDFRLFRSRKFLGATSVGFLANYGFGAVIFFMTLYIQHVLGFSPLQTGFVFLAFTLPFAGLSLMAGRLMGALGASLAMALGMGLRCVAFGVLAFISPTTGVGLVLVGLLAFGIGGALAYNVSTTAAMAAIPAQQAGAASGVQNTIRQMGTVFGVAITGVLFKGLENTELADLLQQMGVTLSSREAEEIQGLLSGSDAAEAKLATLAPTVAGQVETVVREAFVYALDGAMLLCLAISLLGVAAALVVRGPHGGGQVPAPNTPTRNSGPPP